MIAWQSVKLAHAVWQALYSFVCGHSNAGTVRAWSCEQSLCYAVRLLLKDMLDAGLASMLLLHAGGRHAY